LAAAIMLAVLIYALWPARAATARRRRRLGAADAVNVPRSVRLGLAGLGVLYVLLGATFFVAPSRRDFWIDARGMRR